MSALDLLRRFIQEREAELAAKHSALIAERDAERARANEIEAQLTKDYVTIGINAKQINDAAVRYKKALQEIAAKPCYWADGEGRCAENDRCTSANLREDWCASCIAKTALGET